MNGYLTLVATGAPLAARSSDLAAALVGDGWMVDVAITTAGRAWTDDQELEAAAGSPARTDQRRPGTEKSSRRSDVLVVCPATFNTVGKIAVGIADTYVHSMLCEAIGARVPVLMVLMVPMVKESLWNHPAWNDHLTVLADAGVWFTDPSKGEEKAAPVVSGSGDRLTVSFDPGWVVGSLRRRLLRRA